MQISATTVQIVMDVVNIMCTSVAKYSSVNDSNANIMLHTEATDSAGSELWTVKNISADAWLDAGTSKYELI